MRAALPCGLWLALWRRDAAFYGWFTEGPDSPDLQEARKLLKMSARFHVIG